jgi:hypothetical protein
MTGLTRAETPDPAELGRLSWRLIADKVAGEPELLDVPLRNIDRWLANGSGGRDMLERWRQLVLEARESGAGMAALLHLLRRDDEAARHLKSYSPFPGVLTPDEVDRFRCAYQH